IRGGKIRDSNRPMLLAYMQQLHVKTVDLAHELPDEVNGSKVPIGGVDKLVFALPGNPVSCLVTSCLLVQPALKRLRGHTIAQSSPVVFQARLVHPLPLDRDRPEYHRAVVRWEKNEWVATSTGVQASSRLLRYVPSVDKMPGLAVEIVQAAVVADEVDEIQNVVRTWCDVAHVDLIVTSGGTGFSPRDVTPEAVKMLQASLDVTPMAILARPVAGMRGHTLVLTLPGKPNAVVETLTALAPVLPHALHLLQDVSHHHHKGKNALQ
ncbi:hypothetical protein DYB32_000354, partial [Aphanomyces invadans]